MNSATEVSTAEQLCLAASSTGSGPIIVRGRIVDVPSLRLEPGQQLLGEGKSPVIEFQPGVDGVQLTANNTVRGLSLLTSPGFRAIFNQPGVDDVGTLVIESVHVFGQVQILTDAILRDGHISVHNLDIESADAVQRLPQLQGFGVSVLQGAFTLWNLQASARLTADLRGISVGRKWAPVSGGGVFVAGFSRDAIDSVMVTRLTTGDIFTRGGIIPGAPGSTVFISCGVGILWGAHAIDVKNTGIVTTYGDFDMILDNWGTVDRWIAESALTSYGRETAIGFVNFGKIGELVVNAPIETFGTGSRGFNEYQGSLQKAEFARITTHGDASPGIQIGASVRQLLVHGGIETHGGIGSALVAGKFVQLPAYGLSLIDGAEVEKILIEGGIVTHGSFIPPGSNAGAAAVPVAAMEILGHAGSLQIVGGIAATAADGL